MTHKTTRILGLGEFRYTEELLAAAMTRTRADLYREVSERKVYGRSTMSKEQLAVVLVDGYLQEQDAAQPQMAAAGAAIVTAIQDAQAAKIEEAHAEAVVLDEKRTIVRASLSIPTDVELSWDLIEQAFEAYLNEREADVSADHVAALSVNKRLDAIGRLERHPSPEARRAAYEIRDELLAEGFTAQALGDVPAKPATLICAKSFNSDGDRGICGVKQTPGPRGLHEGPHYDEHRRLWSDYTMPGDRCPRCGVEMPALPGMAEFTGPTRTCNLLLNADGECPDVNHRPAARANRVPDTIEAWRMYANKLKASCAATEQYAATLITQRTEAENKLHGLRCALAELVGRWSVGSAKEAQLSRVLESILQEHR